ncbi:histone H1.01 [Drosophila gunungcola]|uniref:H15 domain-containing protein n=1 Tax=Drosophila gunungcola TaxID=103775 RepID=A0A9P9YYS1_9MUSC|nr:histone H1.01 [Drosophila gunungcola]KAI8045596.1 hypothetical protein M5D96_001778 [Drosophila gunungcola]
MKLDHIDSSDDEGEEGMHSDHHESEESDVGEEEEEVEQEEEEQPDGVEPESDNMKAARHPYPTPPPDEGSKMAPPDSGKDKLGKKSAAKSSLQSLALMAIGKLSSRSGSSVQAIMAYLKENGQEWKDPKKTARIMYRALKVAETNGEVVMVKRSFKLTDKYKSSSKAEEKMKAQKQKEKAKKAKAEKVVKEKADKKEAKVKAKEKKAKKEKANKPSERKTKEPGKKKKAEGDAKPPKSKAAAAAAAQAMLETPEAAATGMAKKAAKPSAKRKSESSEVGKSKKPRKSIGTLAQPKATRPKVKAVKKLVAGKEVISQSEIFPSDFSEDQAMSTSTPQGTSKEKRKRKVQL